MIVVYLKNMSRDWNLLANVVMRLRVGFFQNMTIFYEMCFIKKVYIYSLSQKLHLKTFVYDTFSHPFFLTFFMYFNHLKLNLITEYFLNCTLKNADR